MWTLLPLGNPGPDYALTRHNLGRLLLLRWMESTGISATVKQEFPSGTWYGLTDRLDALVPATWMNLSGQVVGEALAAGVPPERLVVLVDDKDLPLGLGRFRLEGSHGGHNGLRSVLEALGGDSLARLRLGIGPFHRPLHEFVLGPWTDEEVNRIDGLDAPFAAFLDLLRAAESLAPLPGRVNAPAFWSDSG
jgi:PTH1 family peptidyl-tRNA hydrolase